MAKQKQEQKEPQVSQQQFQPGNDVSGTSFETGFRWQENRHEELMWFQGNCQVVEVSQQQFQPVLEDDHIEQMIQELLDYGSIELCSVGSA